MISLERFLFFGVLWWHGNRFAMATVLCWQCVSYRGGCCESGSALYGFTMASISSPILVTGGSGFLGRHVVDELRAAGFSVRVFCRGNGDPLERLGVPVFRGDVSTGAGLAEACRGVDAVIHCAGVAGVGLRARPYQETNVEGTRSVVNACREHAVRHLVFTSSPSAVSAWGGIENGDESLPYPERFPAPYPKSKADAERIVLAANGPELATCALRPHLVWGVGDPHLVGRLVAMALSGRLVQIGDGTNRVTLTHVRNAARAHVQALCGLRTGAPLGGRAYFIGDRCPVVLWDWVNDLLRRASLPTVNRSLGLRAALVIGAVQEQLCRVLPFLGEPRFTRFLALQLGTHHSFRHENARTDFGYEPELNPDQAFEELAASLRKTEDSTVCQAIL